MVGFPYYNDDLETDGVYLSDLIVDQGSYFVYGFVLAIMTSPLSAFADDAVVRPDFASVPSPAPARPAQGNRAPTNVRNAVQALVAIAGCGAATKKCGDVANQAINASAQKMGNVNPPTALAVGTCLVLAGYCAGKLTTKGIDRMLGFK